MAGRTPKRQARFLRGAMAALTSVLALAAPGDATAATCRGMVQAMLDVERCARPLLMRHLCSGMAPAAFEALITRDCRAAREKARPCLVRGHIGEGVAPALAREGADEELRAAMALEVNIYTARFEGRLREPAFQCPRPDGGPGRR